MAFLRAIRDGGNRDWTAIFLYPNWLIAACWLGLVCVVGFGIGWKFVGPVLLGWR